MITFQEYLELKESSPDFTSQLELLRIIADFRSILYPKQGAQMKERIGIAEKAVSEGEIYSSDFDSVKYITRYLEDTFDELKYKTYRETIENTIGFDGIPSKPSSTAAIKKFAREWAKLDQKQIQTNMPMLDQLANAWIGYGKIFEYIKSIKKSGKKPKPVDPNTFMKPMAKTVAIKRVSELLTNVSAVFKDKYQQDLTKVYMKKYDEIKDITDKKELNKYDQLGSYLATLIFFVKKYPNTIELKPNSEETIRKAIQEQVDNVVYNFIAKNTDKLALIFEKKANLKSHKLIRSIVKYPILENEMFFEFQDGSSFKLYTQTVYKYSKNGKPFAQFPTRFTDVKLADGKKLSNPSEERMIKEF